MRKLAIQTAAVVLWVGLLLVSSASAQAQVTGHWRSNSGGNYYLHQVGNRVYWLGESPDRGATWTHVAMGSVVGNQINLAWADVTKGRIRQSGTLTVRIADANHLVRVSAIGGFGDTSWTRVGVPPPPPERVSVPNLLNEPHSAAEAKLRQVGLEGRVVGHRDTPNPALRDKVAHQAPPAGTQLPRGGQVGLTLYRVEGGPPPQRISVPNLQNQTLMTALGVLKGVGLRPGQVVFQETGNRTLSDRVLSQAPSAGAPVTRGGTVNLTVYWYGGP